MNFDSSSFEYGLSAYAFQFLRRARKSLENAAKVLKEKSVLCTPVDTGELRSRAFVSSVEDSGDRIEIAVGYEGMNESPQYAVIVHERMDVRHSVGQAKFLEASLHEMNSRYLTIIKEGMRN